MYRHCVFCAADLGDNEVVEAFPVGRRLAFDSGRGRLWVVCRRCERWNLSPLEERWEALEELERAYRDTRTRVATENIGLARLPEGLEVVRVGRPQRPEFAAWRYGDQFGRRRRKFIIGAGIGVGVATGLALGSVALVGVSSVTALPWQLFNLVRMATYKALPGVRIPTTGETVVIPRDQLGFQRIRLSDEHEDGWLLDLNVGQLGDRSTLAGPEAVHALSLILPKLNHSGAGPSKVRQAVKLIEDAGSPEAYFREAEIHARKQGRGYSAIRGLPRELRLALEMAAHEDQERTALEAELSLLEQAWREAEEIAAIADDLLVTGTVRSRLAALRRQDPGD